MGTVKQLVKEVLAKLGYRVEGTRYCPRQLLEPGNLRDISFDDLVCRLMLEHRQDLAFVQVGAYDGVTKDPIQKFISKYNWRGVLLEPQPKAAAQLRELYRCNERITVLQAALDRAHGERTLFTVESDSVPTWAGGMASFQREHIVKHSYLIPGIEAMIREITVKCIPFDDVLKNFPSEQVDLLQIDAEGADGFILSLFPFGRVQPAIVHWERKNLLKSQQEEALELLSRYGYRFAPSGGEDMLATRF